MSKSGPHALMREQDAERPASENRNAGRPASRAAISVRLGPALLPWRIAYRAFAVSAPHLSLTLVLPELCRSTERAGLWGKSTPVIRTPAEGVGRDSRRLGLRID